MRTLIVVRTFYSLMVAINLAITEFQNDDVDLALTDSTNGSDEVCTKLWDESVFKDVYYVKMSAFQLEEKQSFIHRKYKLLRNYMKFFWKSEKYFSQHTGIEKVYDRICVFQVNIDLELCAYNYCWRKNRNVELCIYEEAYLSYFADQGALKINAKDTIDLLSKLSPCPSMRKQIKKAYYFMPEFVQYAHSFEICRMKSFETNKNKLLDVLNRIFDYKAKNEERYHYIYVEDSYHEQGIDIGDEAIVNELYRMLGDELILKLHPRTKNNRFMDQGIPIMKRSDIPLELIILNSDTKMVLLSMYSSGIITPIFGGNGKIASYFLFPCSDKKFVEFSDRIKQLSSSFKENPKCIYHLDDLKEKKQNV